MEETLTHMEVPTWHWRLIRINNAIERINLKIKRRARVKEVFLDGWSALTRICVRLRNVSQEPKKNSLLHEHESSQ